MANIPGTNVAAMIAPFTTEDRFPTHSSLYGKGGSKEVSTLADRDNIPIERLTEGCTCYVVAEQKTYRWLGGEWVEDASSSSSPSGGGVIRLTESEFSALTEKDLTSWYAVTNDVGVLQRIYLGSTLIASRGETGSVGFPYTFPFTF